MIPQPRFKKTVVVKKITAENYKEIIDQWACSDDECRKIKYVFKSNSPEEIVENNLLITAVQNYSFERGILVKIKDYKKYTKIVSFLEKILD